MSGFTNMRSGGAVACLALLGCLVALPAAAQRTSRVIWVDEPERPLPKAVTPVRSARATPFCIRAGVDTYRLTIGIADPEVVGLTLFTDRLTLHGVPVASIEMFDDATHGDDAAEDGVFSADGISLVSMSRTLGQTVLRTTKLTLERRDGAQVTVNADLALTLHYIAATVPLPAAWSGAPDVRRTTHAVSLVREIQGTFPVHSVDLAALSRRYHELFPDDRDFLIAALPFNIAGAPGASFGVVRNDVEGIGLAVFDASENYGSAGVLQGIARLYWGNVGSGTLNHELLHRWAAHLDPSLDLAAPPDTTYNRVHWGAIEQPRTGFARPIPYCGAFDHIEPAPGGGYRTWLDGNVTEVQYNDLELYLMGLLEPEDVASPWNVLARPHYLRDETVDGTRYYLYTAADLRPLAIGDVLAIHGRRRPSAADSQRDFRAALILVYDRPLADVELAYYDLAMREYEKATSALLEATFAAATGGRATITTAIPAPAGAVPAGGWPEPLRLDKAERGAIELSWSPSCAPSDDDYAVYEGVLGDFTSHAPRLCSTGGATRATLAAGAGSAYYLVVPRNAAREGAYGVDGSGAQRPAATGPCVPQETGACP